MEWLNIHTSVLDSPEFLGAGPIQRATWLCLQRYCIGQENGGRIIGASSWGDRKWQQLARITLREVRSQSDLWEWDAQDLVVWSYPREKENEVRTKREVARVNGRKGGRPPSNPVMNTETEPTAETNDKPTSVNSVKAEGKGREGKDKGIGMEVGQNDPAADAAPTSSELPLSDEAKAAKPEKQTDAEWLADMAFDPAYTGIDVPREHNKCIRWCSEHGKQPTRRRFVNWLNRCDKPMQGGGGALMR